METIREVAREGRWAATRQALERAGQRRIGMKELVQVLAAGTLLETSPDHSGGARALVLGHTTDGKALHLSCTFEPGGALILITTYEPQPPHWIDERTRGRRGGAA